MKTITLSGSVFIALLAFPAQGSPLIGEVSYKKDAVWDERRPGQGQDRDSEKIWVDQGALDN